MNCLSSLSDKLTLTQISNTTERKNACDQEDNIPKGLPFRKQIKMKVSK